jgi:hypothetical protein
MTAGRPRCQAHLIFQIERAEGVHSPAKGIVRWPGLLLYSVSMEPVKPPAKPDNDEVVSRRSLGGKLLYVPPAVLAIIKATARPALAQSLQ